MTQATCVTCCYIIKRTIFLQLQFPHFLYQKIHNEIDLGKLSDIGAFLYPELGEAMKFFSFKAATKEVTSISTMVPEEILLQ